MCFRLIKQNFLCPLHESRPAVSPELNHTRKITVDSFFLTKVKMPVEYICFSPLTSLLRSGHYDPDAVRSCAQTVALHWQTLMLRIEDRLKLVNASAAFYRTSQQVPVTDTEGVVPVRYKT